MAFLISIFFLLFFFFFQSASIYGGDAGDLVTAAFTLGVPHPPGFPLYTFLGWLLSRIPYSTYAWRISLLSSIPMAMGLGLAFLNFKTLLKNTTAALIVTAALGFSYLYWLYAIVPEVFALNFFFINLLLGLFFKYRKRQEIKYFYKFALTLGLALTHHQTILLTAAVLIFFLIKDKDLKISRRAAVLGGLFFILGLTPYLYVVLAASGTSPVIWENPNNFTGLWRLVSRAVYGTFTAGRNFGLSLSDRINQIKLLFSYLIIDLNRIGLVLGIIGAAAQFKSDRKNFWLVFWLFVLTGPFFIFYAGFPQTLSFHLATSERFIMTPYFYWSIWIGAGIIYLSTRLLKYLKRFGKFNLAIITGLFILYPLTSLVTNYPKLAPLKSDQTAEKLALDILKSTPEGALFLISSDTVLFDTLYVYYASGGQMKNRDIKLIQFGLLEYEFYQKNLLKAYPELELDPQTSAVSFLEQMIYKYGGKYPVYSEYKFKVPEGFIFLPDGMFYRLYQTAEVEAININEYLQRNETLFNSFNNPKQGALKYYTHTMLDDVNRVYSTANINVGKVLLSVARYADAEVYFVRALKLQPDAQAVRTFLARSLIGQDKCQEALFYYEEEMALFSNPKVFKDIADLYRTCFKDAAKAREFENIYEKQINEKNSLKTF